MLLLTLRVLKPLSSRLASKVAVAMAVEKQMRLWSMGFALFFFHHQPLGLSLSFMLSKCILNLLDFAAKTCCKFSQKTVVNGNELETCNYAKLSAPVPRIQHNAIFIRTFST